MTERKPPEISFETWVDRQIRTAQQRGDFDDLPGAGKPLPGLHRPHDELWWIKDYVQREGLSSEALLPTPLQLRKEIGRLPETVRGLRSERAVRDTVEELNTRILDWLRTPSGPQVPVGPVNVEETLQQWRAHRPAPPASTTAARVPAPAPAKSGWWQRLVHRLKQH